MQQVLNDNLGRQRLTMHERGICVVIPTYNNVGTIRDVVARAKAQCDDVIVVCDGATDGTLEVLRSMEGIVLVEYPQNAGKGEALRQGFRKALAMGFAYAITLDADGQHFPEDMHLFLDANMAHPGALIVGERQMQGADRSAGSRFANSFSNFWFCVQTLHYMPDTQSGYRLYLVPMIEYGANHVLPKRGKYLRRGNVHLQIDRRYPRTEYSLHGCPRQVCRWFRKYYVKQMETLSNRFDRMA